LVVAVEVVAVEETSTATLIPEWAVEAVVAELDFTLKVLL
jgi:hypothetical protein